jgi:YD repeat-containing protein
VTKNSTVTVSGSASDRTPVKLTINGVVASLSSGSFSATVPLAVEGDNVIHIVAVDAAGNTTDSTRTVTRDTQAPTLSLTSPADQAILTGATVTVTGTVQDAMTTTVNANGVDLPVAQNGSFSGSVTVTQGVSFVTVSATDKAGNATSIARQVIYDTTAPAVSLTAPNDNTFSNQNAVTVSGTAADATALNVTVNGAPVTLGAGGAFTTTVATPTEGPLTVTVVATDRGNNQTTVVRHLTVDRTPPAVNVTTPVDASFTSASTIVVSGAITDATATTVTVNGASAPVAGNGTFTANVPAPSEGPLAITIVATDAATNKTTVTRNVTEDRTPPALGVAAPVDNSFTKDGSVTVSGSATDASAVTVKVNGSPVTVGSGGAFATTVPISTDGAAAVTVTATDAAGNQSVATRHFTRDTQAPAMTLTAPGNPFVTRFDTIFMRGNVTDATPVIVAANGTPAPVDAGGNFSVSVPLTSGTNTLTIVATDAAGNTTSLLRSGLSDATPPAISVSQPADGSSVTTQSVNVTGSVQDASSVTVTVNGTPTPVIAGAFSATLSLNLGANTITIVGTDAAGNSTTRTETVTLTQAGPALPPDPSRVATPLSSTSVTPFNQAVAFLYSGNNPIQAGVATGTIGTRSASVVKGVLASAGGQPVTGVQVAVLERSDYGSTVSRADGAYDMAVNGGTPLIVSFSKSGYLPVQRQVIPRWGDYNVLDTVVMTPLDTAVTTVDFTAPIQSGRSSVISDGDGAPRHMTMMFRGGTQATLRMPDGTTQPVTGPLHVRATEYTVGANGLRAMPAALPPASAYTYAVELSTDEGTAAGAASVEFSTPVATYIENFLKFPVGMTVPAGYYDRVRGVWVSSASSARVVKVASITSGLADLIVDTTGVAATPDQLAQFGIDDTERAEVARQFTAGETLWRTAVTHFTPWDINAPWNFPTDVTKVVPRPKRRPSTNDHCKSGGSIIDCEDGTLGESLPIAGTPFSLTYNSQRSALLPDPYSLSFDIPPITGADSLTRSITAEVSIAGRSFTQKYPGSTSTQNFSMTWDGLDAYGRQVQGSVRASIRIVYEVRLVYLLTPENAALFGVPCDPIMERGNTHCVLPDSTVQALGGSSVTPRLYTQYVMNETADFQTGQQLGAMFDNSQKLGGWRLSPQHIYDPGSGRLSLGTGELRTAAGENALSISTVAGQIRRSSARVDGVPALATTIGASEGVVMGSDGSLYIASQDQAAVRRVLPNGMITTVAGNGSYTATGDGGPATQAGISPWGLAIGSDGSLYIADADNNRIRRVDAHGIISTVVGDGNCGTPVEGAQATSTEICYATSIAVGPDGALYFTQNPGASGQIYRVGTDGVITIFAGASSLSCNLREAGNTSNCGDDGPARIASLGYVEGVAAGADGSVYVTESDNGVVRVVDPSGIIHRFAGRTPDGGALALDGDGGLAVNAGLWEPGFLATGPDGSVFIGDDFDPFVRWVAPDGIITSVMGDRSCSRVSSTPCTLSENGPSRVSNAQLLGGLAVGADNTLYLTDVFDDVARRIALPSKPLTDQSLAVASEDLNEYYVFDPSGRHLRTVDPMTGSIIYTFGYDSAGLLTSITDRVGRVTTVERDASGNATAVVSPFGVRTRLAVDAAGMLSSITDPNGSVTRTTMTPSGLLTNMVDDRNGNHSFALDASGRLQSDQDAEGAVQHMTVTATDTSRTATLSTGANRQRSSTVASLPSGGVQLTATGPDGLSTVSVSSSSGEVTSTSPDGVITSVLNGAGDPRFGLDAAIPTKMSIAMPSGLPRTFLTRASPIV